MKKYDDTLILERDDLRMRHINNINDIYPEDFKFSWHELSNYKNVIFIDDNGDMRVFRSDTPEIF